MEFKLKKCETNLVFFRFATQALLSSLAIPHTSKLIWYWKQGRNLNVLYFVHAESDSAKQGFDGSVAVRKKLLLELPAWPFSAIVLWNFWFWIDTKWESDTFVRLEVSEWRKILCWQFSLINFHLLLWRDRWILLWPFVLRRMVYFLGLREKKISHGFLGTTTCAGEVGPACSRGLDSQQIKLQMLMSRCFYVLIWNICLFL